MVLNKPRYPIWSLARSVAETEEWIGKLLGRSMGLKSLVLLWVRLWPCPCLNWIIHNPRHGIWQLSWCNSTCAPLHAFINFVQAVESHLVFGKLVQVTFVAFQKALQIKIVVQWKANLSYFIFWYQSAWTIYLWCNTFDLYLSSDAPALEHTPQRKKEKEKGRKSKTLME